MKDTVRVGVLSFHESKESKAILNAVDALDHEPRWLREENVIVRFRGGSVALEPDVDVIANRLLLSTADQPAELVGIANAIAHLRPVLNDPNTAALASHKIATATALTDAGVPIPDTALALGGSTIDRIRREFGDEFVYKTAIGTHGGGAWKLGHGETITGKVGNRRAFLQEFVRRSEGPLRDLRVYIVGDEIVGAMYRYAVGEDWRTNVALGGRVEGATDHISDEAKSIAHRAVSAVGLDYAGVDLVEGDDGWYVLEVNPTAGFRGLYQATGRSPAPYIAKLAIERGGGTVDRDRVRTLASVLDDSPPRGAPRPESVETEAVVIGLTERVVVSGTTDTRTIIGRADSGANRTSIDLQLAADVGAGPIHTVESADRSGNRREQSRPVVDVVIGLGGTQSTVAASIENHDRMDYPIVLGRDVLRNYQIDVDRRVEERTQDWIEE